MLHKQTSSFPSQISLLATGGTIACTANDETGALEPTVTADQLVARLPENLTEKCQFHTVDLGMLDSSALQLSDLAALVAKIRDSLDRDDIDGIVITHGTDTIEETAAALAALAYLEQWSKPVVLTGAMAPADDAHPDGIANLALASHSIIAGRVPVATVAIAFAGRLFPALSTYKKHSTDRVAFASNLPAAARQWQLGNDKPKPDVARTVNCDSQPFVPVVFSYQGADRTFVDAAVNAGATAIVVAGFGAGNLPPLMVEALKEAASKGSEIIVTTRVPEGGVAPIYGGAGGAATLADQGFVYAGYLPASQARMIAVVAAWAGVSTAELIQQLTQAD